MSCYPTSFEAETFGLGVQGIAVRADRARDVVARGPTSVDDGVNGYLVHVRNSTALASAYRRCSRIRRWPERWMGAPERGYLDRFTEKHFQAAMEKALASVATEA